MITGDQSSDGVPVRVVPDYASAWAPGDDPRRRSDWDALSDPEREAEMAAYLAEQAAQERELEGSLNGDGPGATRSA